MTPEKPAEIVVGRLATEGSNIEKFFDRVNHHVLTAGVARQNLVVFLGGL